MKKIFVLLIVISLSNLLVGQQSSSAVFDSDYITSVNILPDSMGMGQCSDPALFGHDILIKKELDNFRGEITLPRYDGLDLVSYQLNKVKALNSITTDLNSDSAVKLTTIDVVHHKLYINTGSESFAVGDTLKIRYRLKSKCTESIDITTGGQNEVLFSYMDSNLKVEDLFTTTSYTILKPNLLLSAKDIDQIFKTQNLSPITTELLGELKQVFRVRNGLNGQPMMRVKIQIKYSTGESGSDKKILNYINSTKFTIIGPSQNIDLTPTILTESTYEFILETASLTQLGFADGKLKENQSFDIEVYNHLKKDFSLSGSPIKNNRVNVQLLLDISCDEFSQCLTNNNSLIQELQFDYNKYLQDIEISFLTSKGEMCKEALDNTAYVDVVIQNKSDQLDKYQPYFLLSAIVFSNYPPSTNFGPHHIVLIEGGNPEVLIASGGQSNTSTISFTGATAVVDENTNQTALINPVGDGYNALLAGKTITIRYYFNLTCDVKYGVKHKGEWERIRFWVYDSEGYYSAGTSSGFINPIYLTSNISTSSISVSPSTWIGTEGQENTTMDSVVYTPNGEYPVMGGRLFVGCDSSSSLEAEINIPAGLENISVFHQGINVPERATVSDFTSIYFEVVQSGGTKTVHVYNGNLTSYKVKGKYNCSNNGLINGSVTGKLFYYCGGSFCSDLCRIQVRDEVSTDLTLICNSLGGSSCGVDAPHDFDVYRTTGGKLNDSTLFYSESDLLNSPDTILEGNKKVIIQGDHYNIVSKGGFLSLCNEDIDSLVFSFNSKYDIGELISGSELFANGIKIPAQFILTKNGTSNQVKILIGETNKQTLSNPNGWFVKLNLKSSNTSPSNNSELQTFTNIKFTPFYNGVKISAYELTNINPNKVLRILKDDVRCAARFVNGVDDCESKYRVFYRVYNDYNNSNGFTGAELRPVVEVDSFKFILPKSFASYIPELICEFITKDYYNNTTKITPIQFSQIELGDDIILTVSNIDDIPILNYANSLYYEPYNTSTPYLGYFNLKIPYSCNLQEEGIGFETKIKFIDDIMELGTLRGANTKPNENVFKLSYGNLQSNPTVGGINQEWNFKLRKNQNHPVSWLLFENKETNVGEVNFPTTITDNLGNTFNVTPLVVGEKYVAILTGMSINEERTFTFNTTFSNCHIGVDSFYVKAGWACEATLESILATHACNESSFLPYSASYLLPGVAGLKVKNVDASGVEIPKSKINICDDFYYEIETSKEQTGYLNGANLEIKRSSGLEVKSVEVSYIDATNQVVDTKTFSSNIGEVLSLNSLSGIADTSGWDDEHKLKFKIRFKGSCSYDFSQPIIFNVTSERNCGEVSSGNYIEDQLIEGVDLNLLKVEISEFDFSILSLPGSEKKINVSYKRSDIEASEGWEKVSSSRVVQIVPFGMEITNDALLFIKGGIDNAVPTKKGIMIGGVKYYQYTWEGIVWDTDSIEFEYTLKDQTFFVGGVDNFDVDIFMGLDVKVELNCSSGEVCNSWLEVQREQFILDPQKTLPPNCDECISSFSPMRGKEYVVSCWVSSSAPEGKTDFSGIVLKVWYQGASGVETFKPTGQVIDGWQRIEGILRIPTSATKINIEVENEGVGGFYLDDIRMSPKNSSFVTYVYDPLTLRLVAELDEHNYATIYEYDEEGALVRVKKETERGVQTIQESRNNMRRR